MAGLPPAAGPDCRRVGDPRRRAVRHLAGDRVRREHRRHPDGRTHRTCLVVTAVCFLPCFFIAPIVAAVPAYATASVLVLVGLAMFESVRDLDFTRIEQTLPAFVTIVLIPLTSSITQGILWGFLALRGAPCGRRPRARGGCVLGAGGAVRRTAAASGVNVDGSDRN